MMNRWRLVRQSIQAGKPLPAAVVVTVIACIVVGVVSGVAALTIPSAASSTAVVRLTVDAAVLATTPSGAADLNLTVTNSGATPATVSAQIKLAQSFLPLSSQTVYPVGPGKTVQETFPVGFIEHFEGLSGSVSASNSPSLNPRNFTLDFEFQYSSLSPDQQQIIGKGGASGNSFYFYSYRSVDNINDFVIYENGTRYDQQLGDIFTVGTWYDVTLTVNGSSIGAYVDGRLTDSWAHAAVFLGNDAPLVIGACGCGGYFFNGSLAYALMYDRALSPAEVASDYATPGNPTKSGLVLWYDFLPAPNGTIPDLSDNGNYGTASGNATSFAPVQPGISYVVVVSASASSGMTVSTTLSLRAE